MINNVTDEFELDTAKLKILTFFRLFDIWKPFPVNYVDKNIKGGLGIMLDDILSGIYVIIILTFSLFFLGS